MTTATLNFAPMTHALRPASGGDKHSVPPVSIKRVQSADLLEGGKSIGIEHNGETYRLQLTKLGKLILTK